MPRKTKAQIKREQTQELRQWITIVILSAFIIIAVTRSGLIGTFMYNVLRWLFGELYWLVLGLIIVLTLVNLLNRKNTGVKKNPAPVILLIAAILLLCTYVQTDSSTVGFDPAAAFISNFSSYFEADVSAVMGGGILGAVMFGMVSSLFGRSGTVLLIAVLFIIAMLLLISLDVYKKSFTTVADFFRVPDREEKAPKEPREPFNIWKFFSSRKAKKKKFDLKAEEGKEQPSDTTIMATHPDPSKPYLMTLNNVVPDEPTEKITVVHMPGQTISSAESVFIDIDDLLQDAPGSRRRKQPAKPAYPEEPAYPDYEQSSIDIDELTPEEKPEPQPKKEPKEPAEEPQETVSSGTVEKKKRDPFKNYRTPNPYRLLEEVQRTSANTENEMAAREKGQLLISILRNFDIEAELIDTHIGPSVTQFEIRPDVNVKVSKIIGLADNIKMQLAAKDVRIEAPIPGRNAVGVEIPNVRSTPVKMRELFRSLSQKENQNKLLFVVGKDLLGQTITCRLDKMPHLLIAGATGSGKSVCMNAIITSLLLRTKPDEVKLLLVDPKKVEFTPYHNVPHLIGPVINDPTKASNALKVIVQMMDERYNVFAAAGVRNIEVYNEKVKAQAGRPNEDGSPAPKILPYIVVIIDELADLMSVAGKEVESSIQRITQLARAAGIHLIVATQRPSTDVITGIIKANIPSRIAFAVSSGIDSRTILDHVGAERLLGNGDMLYMPIGQSAAQRVQGVFVTDEEVRQITEDVKKRAKPEYDDHFVMLEGVEGNAGIVSVSEDPMYEEIKEYVIEAQKASTSLLQRRFGIGYNRGARIIDALEADGIIGPAQGSKPREVYIKKDKK